MSDQDLILFLIMCNLSNIFFLYLNKKNHREFKQKFWHLLNEQSKAKMKENKNENNNKN